LFLSVEAFVHSKYLPIFIIKIEKYFKYLTMYKLRDWKKLSENPNIQEYG